MTSPSSPGADVVDLLVGLAPGMPLHAVRHQRDLRGQADAHPGADQGLGEHVVGAAAGDQRHAGAAAGGAARRSGPRSLAGNPKGSGLAAVSPALAADAEAGADAADAGVADGLERGYGQRELHRPCRLQRPECRPRHHRLGYHRHGVQRLYMGGRLNVHTQSQRDPRH